MDDFFKVVKEKITTNTQDLLNTVKEAVSSGAENLNESEKIDPVSTFEEANKKFEELAEQSRKKLAELTDQTNSLIKDVRNNISSLPKPISPTTTLPVSKEDENVLLPTDEYKELYDPGSGTYDR